MFVVTLFWWASAMGVEDEELIEAASNLEWVLDNGGTRDSIRIQQLLQVWSCTRDIPGKEKVRNF